MCWFIKELLTEMKVEESHKGKSSGQVSEAKVPLAPWSYRDEFYKISEELWRIRVREKTISWHPFPLSFQSSARSPLGPIRLQSILTMSRNIRQDKWNIFSNLWLTLALLRIAKEILMAGTPLHSLTNIHPFLMVFPFRSWVMANLAILAAGTYSMGYIIDKMWQTNEEMVLFRLLQQREHSQWRNAHGIGRGSGVFKRQINEGITQAYQHVYPMKKGKWLIISRNTKNRE